MQNEKENDQKLSRHWKKIVTCQLIGLFKKKAFCIFLLHAHCIPADWESNGDDQLMGILTAQHVRGKEIFAFEYNESWMIA